MEVIEEGYYNIAPNIGIRFPESQLIKIEQQPKFSISFEAGFEVREKNYRVLFFIRRSSDNADIPKIATLMHGWITQAKKAESQIVREMSTWFLDQIDLLKKNVKETQDEIIDRYQSRLDKAYQEVEVDYERQKMFGNLCIVRL